MAQNVKPVKIESEGKVQDRTMLQMMWRSYRRHRPAMIGTITILILAAGAFLAPFIAPYDPEQIDLINKMQPPSATHWMGTDELGRDIFTRILYGGQISLTIGLMAMTIAVTVGVVVGGLAG